MFIINIVDNISSTTKLVNVDVNIAVLEPFIELPFTFATINDEKNNLVALPKGHKPRPFWQPK